MLRVGVYGAGLADLVVALVGVVQRGGGGFGRCDGGGCGGTADREHGGECEHGGERQGDDEQRHYRPQERAGYAVAGVDESA